MFCRKQQAHVDHYLALGMYLALTGDNPDPDAIKVEAVGDNAWLHQMSPALPLKLCGGVKKEREIS